MPFQAHQAQREKLKLIANISGASGSGKTYGALLLAKGLMDAEMPEASEEEKWKAIAVIDTEHNRSLVYADMKKHGHYIGAFTHIPFEAPHNPLRYKEALAYAKSLAYVRVVVTDGMTHAWKEILQEQQDRGGRYQDWKDIRPKEAAFWEEIFEQNTHHMITTTRAKQSYVLEKSEMEKLEVKKLGLQPVQNDQLEYEYMVNFMAEQDHQVWATKDNTPLFEELKHFTIEPKHGQDLYAWLSKGTDPREREKAQAEKDEIERITLIEEVEQMIEKDSWLKSELAKLEHHPKVQKSLGQMNLDWVKRVKTTLTQKLAEEKAKAEQPPESEYDADEQPGPDPEPEKQNTSEPEPEPEQKDENKMDREKALKTIDALKDSSIVAAASLTDFEMEFKKQPTDFSDTELEKAFRKILSRTWKEGTLEELKNAAKVLRLKSYKDLDADKILVKIGEYVFH